MIGAKRFAQEARGDTGVSEMDKASITRIGRLRAGVARDIVLILVSDRLEVVTDLTHHVSFHVLLLDVVNYKQVQWL